MHHNLVATVLGYTIPKASMTPWTRKTNFQFSYQTICSPCQTTHTSWTYIPRKTIYMEKKKAKKKNEVKKVLLALHKFFTNDLTTTKTFFVAYDGKTISKSWCTSQICWPFASKTKCWTLKFRLGTHHIWMLSCLNSNNDLKAQKLSTMKLKVWSQYTLYLSP